MLEGWVITLVSLAYLGILFAVAFYADKRADAGKSIISNPYIYTLSIAVYCTAWTFYGSVGRAATTGVGFLPIYLGPTLIAALWWILLRKIIRIAKVYRITSIADFIASRYGKSTTIAALVTFIAVIGTIPYIALQLKALSNSFNVLLYYPDINLLEQSRASAPYDTALYVTLIMAAFSILFGTRHIDITERHEGVVAAIAFESLVKLLAFSAVGIFVTFFLFDGPGDLFSWVPVYDELSRLMEVEAIPGEYTNWLSLTFLAMMAILFLPRQFQILVVENTNEDHVRKASWLFPLYLLAINLFVLPISFAGLLLFPEGGVDPDTFVLTVPIIESQELLALFVFIGGLSAVTGMIIVATIALSTLVCNDLLMPALLRIEALPQENLGGVLLGIRRGSIVAVLLLGYLYYRLIGGAYALVSIGLISFTAAAQFAPPLLAGIYWKGASRRGAISGLLAGFIVWTYTLLLPSFAKAGWISSQFVEYGPFGIELLRPQQLLGLDMFDPITHTTFWTMLVNIGFLFIVSIHDRQSPMEQIQATLFVDVFSPLKDTRLWSGTARVAELKNLVARFIGREQADRAFEGYAKMRGIQLREDMEADSNLVGFAERELSGAIGSASARIMVSSVIKGEGLSMEGVMKILDETSQVIEYSHQLEQKSQELVEATRELQEANRRLQELDRLKDDFVSTVSHELRTPLTSVRAFSEILHDNPNMDDGERQKFLAIIVKETERLTRLTNQVLDLAKIESGKAEWHIEKIDLVALIRDALGTTSHLFQQKSITLEQKIPDKSLFAMADRDRITQVVINLISNAVKFCEPEEGRVRVSLTQKNYELQVTVADNGPGVSPEEHERIFDKFHQISNRKEGKPKGTGLGLAICQRIITHHGGKIWLDSSAGAGATFSFTIPRFNEEHD